MTVTWRLCDRYVTVAWPLHGRFRNRYHGLQGAVFFNLILLLVTNSLPKDVRAH